MKSLIVIFLSLALLSTRTFAEDEKINPDTARAYEGYLVTFLWPEALTKEEVDYKNVLSSENLVRLTGEESAIDDQDSNTGQPTPFGNIEEKLDQHVTILANQKWTLIFRFPGDTIKKSFHSHQEKDGYPELTANIAIKLGRYLESDIQYKHYLFDRYTQPDTSLEQDNQNPPQTNISPFVSQQTTEPELETELKEFEPALVLTLNQSNKTASKKVNYLDHPTIGTLLYFEPIELEDAIERVAEQSVSPETGRSLTYDSLQSTNELKK